MGEKAALVTGGAGFIGSNLVGLLIRRGYRVRVVDDFSAGTKENLSDFLGHARLEVIHADIRDQGQMLKASAGMDLAFHLAAQCLRLSLSDPGYVHDVNATGTLRVIEACRASGVRRFIYVSSSEVYGSAVRTPMDEEHPLNPTTVYGASKLAGELYALAYHRTCGMNVSVIRPFNNYGYFEHVDGVHGEVIPRFVARAVNGLPLQVFGDGSATRDFIFVEDTVRGMELAAARDDLAGQIFNVAYGRETRIIDLARIVLEMTGSSSRIEHLEARPGDVQRHFADNSKAKRFLGFEPTVELRDGLKRYVQWVRDRNPDPEALLAGYEARNW